VEKGGPAARRPPPSMGQPTDDELMHAYCAGDARAFELLLARYERPVWVFVRRSVGDLAVAEDLLQDVFLHVVKGRNQWRAQAKFSTWLYAIARNLCVDQARRARSHSADSPQAPADAPAPRHDEPPATLVDHVPAASRNAEGLASDGQIRTRVDAAIAALPPDQREVFLMRETLDMSFVEIAAVTGISESTVKSRMRYALGRLREALHDFDERARAAGACAGGGAGAAPPVISAGSAGSAGTR
jgi:RNA polymerase sigma-70 factor (ECF subfamily)